MSSMKGKPRSLHFPSPDQLRNMDNYLKFFPNPMHSRKIVFLNIKGIQKMLTKTIHQIQMFPNQIQLVKMKNEIVEVS